MQIILTKFEIAYEHQSISEFLLKMIEIKYRHHSQNKSQIFLLHLLRLKIEKENLFKYI